MRHPSSFSTSSSTPFLSRALSLGLVLPLSGALAAALTGALAGCGNVAVEGTGGSGAGGSGAGGSGGASTTGAGGLPACGGTEGLPCADDEFCFFDKNNNVCGLSGEPGMCLPRTHDCDLSECTNVCGCDGAPYCNECEALAAGTDINKFVKCAPDQWGYSAVWVETTPPALVLFRATEKGCTRVWLHEVNAVPPDSPLTVTPPWYITGIDGTDTPADCSMLFGYPANPDSSWDAKSVSGTVELDGVDPPCGVTANLTIEFTNGFGKTAPEFVTDYLPTGLCP